MVRYNSPLGHNVTVIDHEKVPIRFLILDCPTESTLPIYVNEFLKRHVTTVVRCCQATYNADLLFSCGIDLLDLPFQDGGCPSLMIMNGWVDLIEKYTHQSFCLPTTDQSCDDKPTIAVHCVAGLGRAPVLVAIGMIELGVSPLDAVAFIRQKRRGAFNRPQIRFLDQYKRITKLHRRTDPHRQSSSLSTTSTSSSVFSWGGRMMSKLTNKSYLSSSSSSSSVQQQQQPEQYQQLQQMA